MKPLAYYSKSKDYVCTPQERTLLKLYKTYTVPLIPVPKPLNADEIIELFEKAWKGGGNHPMHHFARFEEACRLIEERHGIK